MLGFCKKKSLQHPLHKCCVIKTQHNGQALETQPAPFETQPLQPLMDGNGSSLITLVSVCIRALVEVGSGLKERGFVFL